MYRIVVLVLPVVQALDPPNQVLVLHSVPSSIRDLLAVNLELVNVLDETISRWMMLISGFLYIILLIKFGNSVKNKLYLLTGFSTLRHFDYLLCFHRSLLHPKNLSDFHTLEVYTYLYI